jgi:nitroimidazol reductase NimA-like FMN-containing flavoprotein (pyridoxamine 5'-phosphate oxidase superfamily)
MRGWCPRPRSSLSTPAPPPVRRSRPLSQDPVRPEPTDGPREAAPSDRVRVRRKPDRGHYEKEIVDAILDAGLVAHVGFVVDGQPYVIPTLYWRDGEHVYWHGSAASRMIRTVESGVPVCLTVSHIDSIILARSGFNSSADYRSVVVVGVAEPVTGDEKARALDRFLDALAPGRATEVRPMTEKELKQTAVVRLSLDEASAKVRDAGLGDDPGDETWTVWAGTIPVRMAFGEPVPAADLPAGIELPENVRALARR